MGEYVSVNSPLKAIQRGLWSPAEGMFQIEAAFNECGSVPWRLPFDVQSF